MRYWIWWNDLVQGPFDLDELTSLRSFSEDLLVCMEDREDWLPAGRVADLSSAIEQLKARYSKPLSPPPPPPSRPPTLTPLQGEFFGEPPGQQPLLESEDEPKGPYAFRPITTGDPDAAGESSGASFPYPSGMATMPFHFSRQPQTGNAVLDLPRLQPQKIAPYAPRPVIKESPVRVEEPLRDERRAVPKTIVDLKVLQEETIQETPEAIAPAVQEDVSPSMAPAFEEPLESPRKLEWLPWIMGVVLALGALGSAGYWVMDHASTRSAIAEANRMEPPKPITIPPVTSFPTPSPAVQAAAAAQRAVPVKARKRNTWISSLRQTLHRLLKKHSAPRKTISPVVPVPAAAANVPAPAVIEPTVSATTQSPIAHAAQTKKNKKSNLAHAVRKKASGLRTIAKKAATVPVAAVTPAVLPGIAKPSVPAPAESLPVARHPSQTSPHAADPWAGQQTQAIKLVMDKTLPKSKVTIGSQARTMLQQMHEKELMHAADTGERLYLPDKMSWAALQEEGSRYRVYLNFMASQANGERIQARSYQFIVDLKAKTISGDDPATQQDLMTDAAELNFKHNPMATDIESILGGVDTYDKHKVQLMIVKKNRSNREERKKIDAAVASAQNKVKRSVLYFLRTYPEMALKNIAKAYNFEAVLKE